MTPPDTKDVNRFAQKEVTMVDPSELLETGEANALRVTAALREQGDGVHVIQDTGWGLVTRYDDVSTLLRRPTVFSSERFAASPANIHDADDPLHRRYVEAFGQVMLFQDPPVHTRLRAIVKHMFSPAATKRMRDDVEHATDDILAALAPGSEVDFVKTFAGVLPVWVIARILGVPVEDREQFRLWSAAFVAPMEPTCVGAERDEAIRTAAGLIAYLEELIESRRASPGEDLISELLAAEDGGDRLTGDELAAMISLLLVAGNETTTNLLSAGLQLLFEHPEEHRRLREDPKLVDSAVEEMLRFDPPFRWIGRVMKEDCTLGAVTLRSGQWVFVSIAGANRDPRRFTDPDRFDISRESNRHLTFGSGIHYCLGAPLARLEGTIAFPRLLERFPRLQPGATPPTIQSHFGMRSILTQPVRL